MKNRISTILIFISISLLINCFPVYTQITNTAGKIKTKVVHEEKTDKGKKTTSIESEEKFDQNGNTIEEIQYKDGKIDKHIVYVYDANNNKIKETELDASGKPKKMGEYKYQNGLRTEKYTYDASNKLISKKTYTYTY